MKAQAQLITQGYYHQDLCSHGTPFSPPRANPGNFVIVDDQTYMPIDTCELTKLKEKKNCPVAIKINQMPVGEVIENYRSLVTDFRQELQDLQVLDL